MQKYEIISFFQTSSRLLLARICNPCDMTHGLQIRASGPDTKNIPLAPFKGGVGRGLVFAGDGEGEDAYFQVGDKGKGIDTG